MPESYRRKPNTVCHTCTKPVYKRPAEIDRGRVFCGNACKGVGQRNTNPCLVCGTQILSSQNKKTCSRDCAKAAKQRGLYGPRGPYRPRGRLEMEIGGNYQTVRRRVLRVRGRRCETCGYARVHGVLETHHIIFRSNEGPDTDENLLVLCPTCHAEIHYGAKDKTEYRGVAHRRAYPV